jgi:hypothetical protein
MAEPAASREPERSPASPADLLASLASSRGARRLATALPLLLVVGFALGVLWPAPAGHMPLSADHTVHLTRITMFAEQLAEGRLRGWDTTWFFGTPVGELYPVLGDLVVVAIHALGLGALSWPQAYALGFTVVFATQGLAMLRVGRALGLGPVPGLVAALWLLADAGAYREGGFMYTVFYGVWPQALATALGWLAVAELCVACETDDPIVRRTRIATTALATAAALLAHPMAMLGVALGAALVVLGVGLRSRAALRRTVPVTALATGLGVATAAWWLGPMLEHRAWMASYGWMWEPLDRMVAQALEGHWAQAMPTAVGMVVSLGLLLLLVLGSPTARTLAGLALVQWLLASRDVLWGLRLDHLGEGFTHIQYQRFIIAAKPGLGLAAGAGLALLLRAAAAAWRGQLPRWGARWGRRAAAGLVGVVLGLMGLMIAGQRQVMREHHVGEIQRERLPGEPAFDDEYAQLLAWLRDQPREQAGVPWRATVLAGRNQHWFMDAPALTGVRLYKQGFTPGDNFVHKPEAGSDALLDRLRVRYVIAADRRGARGADEVARFGRIRVLERRDWARPIAWLEGPGTLEVLEDDADHGVVRARVSGSGPDTRVVFGVAGFPRWALAQDGTPVEWHEVPAVGRGPSVTQAERRAGARRGGKAHGDDGTEPMLIAAVVGDGELALRYHARRTPDVLAGLLSLLALAGCGVLLWRPRRWTRPTARLDALLRRMAPLGHPYVVAGAVLLVVVGAAVKERRASEEERARAVGWADEGLARLGPHARAGLLKADMLIRPAVLVDPRRKQPARLVFPGVTLGDTLTGWIALDDDAAKQRARGRHTLRVEAVGSDGALMPLASLRVAHRPGRHLLALDTAALAGQRVELHVTLESDGESPPPLGFDLDLGAPP